MDRERSPDPVDIVLIPNVAAPVVGISTFAVATYLRSPSRADMPGGPARVL